MRYGKIVDYKIRRYLRLYSRALNLDAKHSNTILTQSKIYGIINMDENNALPFGLCKENNIDLPDTATPTDAWNALKGLGITPGNAYKALEESEAERKKIAGSSGKKEQPTDDQVKAKFKRAKASDFGGKLTKAKAAVHETHPDSAWRVADGDYTVEDYSSFKNFESDGGSVVSVKPDGDIVSVCHDPKDLATSGRDILRNAVLMGGTKLDSFSGNHGFYCKCGFEPVSWCDFDDEYAPDDWLKRNGIEPGDTSWYGRSENELRQKREPIIFYQYTGKVTSESAKDFCNRVPPSNDYMAAEKARDEMIEANRK